MAGAMRPEGTEFGIHRSAQTPVDAEEIFEPFTRGERVTLHVEEDVAVIGRREHGEAAAERTRQQFKAVLAGCLCFELEPRLGRELGDGVAAHAVHLRER
jgi:hypothetical protein